MPNLAETAAFSRLTAKRHCREMVRAAGAEICGRKRRLVLRFAEPRPAGGAHNLSYSRYEDEI